MKHRTEFTFSAFFSLAALMTSGCVSSGTYKAKEQESIQLSRNLVETKGAYQELEEKNKKLSAEGEALKEKLKKLDTETALMKTESEKLKIDNDKCSLENEKLSQAARPENLLKALAGIVADLQAENAKLKQSLVAAEKASAKKVLEPPVKLNPVITKPAASGIESSAGKQEEGVDAGNDSARLPKHTTEKPVELNSKEPGNQAPAIDDILPDGPAAELK